MGPPPGHLRTADLPWVGGRGHVPELHATGEGYRALPLLSTLRALSQQPLRDTGLREAESPAQGC